MTTAACATVKPFWETCTAEMIAEAAPETIAEFRKAMGWTQEEAGEKTGLTRRGWQYGELKGLKPSTFELILLRFGEHPDFVVIPRKK